MSHTQKRLVVTTQDDQATGCASFEDRQSYSPDTIVLYHDNAKADARRLVACWNYCDGISTEDLENDQALANVFNRGLNERAELADALAQAVAFMDGQSTPVNALVNARAILAKHGRQS